MTIAAAMTAAENVVRGWLGQPIPPMPKHRSRSRAAYRKTARRVVRERPAAVEALDRGRP
jgi:hypothetical protein